MATHYLKTELDELARNDAKVAELLQNNSPGGIWYWDLETVVDAWMSPRFWELFGHDSAHREHLASEWMALCFPEDLETPHDSLNKSCAKWGTTFDQVLRYCHKQGHAIWVRCQGVVVRDDAGQALRMLGAHTDVTAMMQIEEEARQRRHGALPTRTAEQDVETLIAYKAVLNAFPIGICLWEVPDHTDPGAMILRLVNDGANQVSDADLHQFVGQTMRVAFPELLETTLPQSYIDVLKSGEATNQEIEYGDSNIAKKWFDVCVFKVGASLVAISYDDITQRKLADEELAATQRRLERSNSELEQFAYVASHDLQEPMRMVANFTELLGKEYEDKLDEQAQIYIRYASDGAKRMQSLIESLLSVSRVTMSTAALVPVDIDALVEQILNAMTHSKTLAGVAVKRDPLPIIMGDEQELTRVFYNVIGNALKFNRSETPTLTISARSSGAKVEIAITDNGVGIPKHQHKKIFEMFQRLHKRSEFDGTGMGLSIARRIMERHSGSIELESVVGEGTTFRLTFLAAGA